jgi:hypothetical protein
MRCAALKKGSPAEYRLRKRGSVGAQLANETETPDQAMNVGRLNIDQ